MRSIEEIRSGDEVGRMRNQSVALDEDQRDMLEVALISVGGELARSMDYSRLVALVLHADTVTVEAGRGHQ